MDDGDDGLVVKVVHASRRLHGPVHQRARRDAFSCQGSVQRAPPRELHDQAQVGLLQAQPQESHDVGMAEHGEELGLLPDALHGLLQVLVRVTAGCFDRHLHALPHGAVDLPETADPDDLLQDELGEIDLQD